MGGMERLKSRIDELQSRAREMGRGHIPVSIFGTPPETAIIEAYREMGVDRVIFGLRPEGSEQALGALKHHAEVVKAYV